MYWFALALLSAFSLASADAATKWWLRDYLPGELLMVRFTFAGLLVSPFLLFTPFPSLPPQFWYWLALLIPLELVAMFLYLRAIRDYSFSLTLPYLAFTPVCIVLTGWILLGEKVSLEGLAGILLVVLGAWFLNLKPEHLATPSGVVAPLKAIVNCPAARLMLGVACIYSVTSVGGKGAMRYMPPELFGPFYFSVLGLATFLVFTFRSLDAWRVLLRRPGIHLLVGLLMGIMVVTHFFAIERVEAAYMIAVKRSSLLFGILYGALLFKEPRLAPHLIAGAIMVAGVVLIALAH